MLKDTYLIYYFFILLLIKIPQFIIIFLITFNAINAVHDLSNC